MKTLVSKKPFSLLEIFIAIIIIGICSSVMGIKVYKSVEKHRFNTNIAKIKSHIEYCKKMAIVHQTDVILTFYQKENQIKIEISTDEDHGLFYNIKKQTDDFININFVFNLENREKITINFFSTGYFSPKGSLDFSDKKNIYFSSVKI